MAKITLAGENLIAQKMGSQQVLQIARFIYANVPGLNPTAPIDRAAGKPPAGQIVHTYTIPPENSGYVNPNQVVYSSMLGSDIGDFDFNWIGLESAEGVLFAIAYVPLQQKRKNLPPNQTGNNVTRNMLVEYSGAQALTGITIDAKTWQHDFTVRLAGIDERTRLGNRDVYGRACFIGTALQLEKVGTAYQLKPGVAYLEGIRISRSAATPVTMSVLPARAWLDVFMQRQGNDLVPIANVVFGPSNDDYVDSVGARHYLVPIADISSTGVISDLRASEAIDLPLVKHFATVKSVTDLVDGTTPAGKAKQLSTPRKLSVTGAATGSAQFDGSSDVSLQITLSDNGVVEGSYAKVVISKKGLVIGSEELTAFDIPNLDWNKIKTGKPTTAAGYGITDVLLKTENAVSASKLATSRTLSFTGDATGSNSFDGTSNVSFNLTLKDNGVVPGVYSKLKISSKGLVIGSEALTHFDIPALDWSKIETGKPTTAAGYGITDVLLKTENAVSASKLVTARTIAFSGDATGSNSFDGSSNVTVNLTLRDNGVVPGAYPKLKISSKGLVIGSEPLVAADLPADALNRVGITGAFRRLTGFAPGNSSVVSYSAQELVVSSAANNYQTLRAVAISASTAVSGVGGLDTGVVSPSTWYSVWAIWNGPAVSGLLSLSETEPKMPAGYSHKARVGWVRTDATGNAFPLGFLQFGKRVQYRILSGTNVSAFTKVASGSTANVLTPVSVSSAVPPTASSVKILTGTTSGVAAITFVTANDSTVAADNALGGAFSYTNNNSSTILSSDILLESKTLYYSSNSAAAFFSVTGWEDSL